VLWDADPANPLPTLTQHFLLVPIGLVIMAMPLFPGGAGIGELGFGLLYGWFGYPSANGVLCSLVQRVLSWVIGLVGGGLSTRMRPSLERDAGALAEEAAEPEEVAAGGEPGRPAVETSSAS